MLLVAAPARGEIVEEVAATVNGQILTRTEIQIREAQVRQSLSRQFSGSELERKLGEARKELLTDMIRELILTQRAEILGLDLDRVYKSALDNLREQQGIKTNDEMNALLKQEGITQEELRQILLRYNVPDIMINLEVRQKLLIPEEELKSYFDKHREEFRVEETYKVRELVLLSEGHGESELGELTEKIKGELAAGLSFTEAVIKYSEAPSRFQEGVIGPFNADDLSKDLRSAVSTLKQDEYTGPIVMKGNYHFVQLVTRTEASEPDFEKVKAGIENKVKQEKFAGALNAYWDRLFKENRITIKEPYRMFAEGVPHS
jgi:parvulin-like peptidyl-prolyl isomerase